MKPTEADMQTDDLAQRMDAASDNGGTAALESLDAECACLLGPAGPPDALLYVFRSDIQEGL